MLERRVEIDLADQALRAAHAGEGSLLVVTGPPGVGTSALLGRLVEAATSTARVLRGDGTLLESDFPFGVVHQLFQPLVVDASDAERAAWFRGGAGAVRPMFADESRPVDGAARPASPDTVLHGLTSLVVNLARERTLLIAVDDLQRVDRSSLRWLGYLAKRLDGANVLLAGTISDDCVASDPTLLRELATSAGRTLQLRPLSVDAVDAVVSDVFQEPCHRRFAHACHEVSGGYPASLMAVARGLKAKGYRPLEAQAADAYEESHLLLRERRMAGLRIQSETVRALARAMVVLGDQAEPELVRELVGMDSVDYRSARRSIDCLGLLAGTGASPLRFIHPSVRHGVESTMTVGERGLMHGRAATLLHSRGHPPEHVAQHLLLVTSGLQRWGNDVLRAAAGSALDRGSAATAARYLRRALLDSAPDSEERGRLLVDLAAAERTFDLVSCARHAEQAAHLLKSVADRAVAVLQIPPTVAATNPSVRVLVREVATRSQDQTSGVPLDLRMRLEARVRLLDIEDAAHLHAAVGRLRELRAAPPISTGAGRELLTVLTYAAALTVEMSAGEVAPLALDIIEREPADGHTYTTLPFLAQTLIMADSADAALPWLQASWDRARRRQPDRVATMVGAELGAVLLALGQVTRARDTALRVLETADGAWPESHALVTRTLALIALETRDAELGEKVLAVEQGTTGTGGVVVHRLVRGMIAAVRGDLSGALDRFLDTGKQLARFGWRNPALFPWRVWAAEILHQTGRTDAALALAREEHSVAVEWGTHSAQGRALRLIGTLLEGDARLDHLDQAVAVLRHSPNRLELSRSVTMLGRTLLGTRSPGAAELLSEGRRLAAECGVSWVDGDDTSGPEPAALRLLPSARVALTKAEQAVADLVVQDWTNQQIADSLGITRRAVEKNLTSVYRKLGVGGRAALIGELSG